MKRCPCFDSFSVHLEQASFPAAWTEKNHLTLTLRRILTVRSIGGVLPSDRHRTSEVTSFRDLLLMTANDLYRFWRVFTHIQVHLPVSYFLFSALSCASLAFYSPRLSVAQSESRWSQSENEVRVDQTVGRDWKVFDKTLFAFSGVPIHSMIQRCAHVHCLIDFRVKS